jgi:SagB-type dehydrogenase family enzyme
VLKPFGSNTCFNQLKKEKFIMKSRLLWILMVLFGMIAPVNSGSAKEFNLPARPAKSNVDIVGALEQRRTTREYSPATLSLEDLSALLWAANGVNRPDGKRTAPSAHGRQYIDVYVVGDNGGYLYDAPGHKLIEATDQKVKDRLARQGHIAKSSHVLVLVADLSKVPGSSEDTKLWWAHSTAGTIAQNVHLMAAARGIGTGIVAGIKADEIRQALGLSKDAVPLYVMPLGYLK